MTAKDKGTGKQQKITITASSGLSKEEIEKMKRDADSHAEEDKKKRELIEARNQADSLIYTAEKAVRDGGEKISADVKKEIEEKVAALKAVKDGDALEAIKTATQELSTAAQKIGTAMYGNAEQPQPAAAPEGEAKSDEAVVEGEVEEKEDKKE